MHRVALLGLDYNTRKGLKSIGKTSSESKMRWMKDNYKRYQVQFRVNDDADLISFIDQHKEMYGTTEIFRIAVDRLKNEGLK